MSVEAFRTPEERFAQLPDFPWEPVYSEWEGMRLARIDEQPSEVSNPPAPVIFFHGEPTWSFLWRHVIPPVLAAGHRCIAPDLPGFGRSDKPVDVDWYSYDHHSEAMGRLVDQLDLRDATAVVHDWGGPIGLRIATEYPRRIARLVILDTGLFTGQQRMSDAWMRFRSFVERTEDLPISFLVDGATQRDLTEAELAAYDAPFPTIASKTGARAFPLMLPLKPYDRGAAAGQRVLLDMSLDDRPTLMLWGESDPVLPPETGRRFAAEINRPEPELIAGASHFLQEDAGRLIGERIAGWLAERDPQ